MGTSPGADGRSLGTILGALSSTTKTVELLILVIVVVLLVLVVVLILRGNRPPRTAKSQPTPQALYGGLATRSSPQSPQHDPRLGQAPDPFAGVATGPAQPVPAPVQAEPMAPMAPMAAPGAAAPPVAPVAATPSTPAPATPAGWLPDPSGVPNTLRYWDGRAWTQHVARRS
jgi:hypothetical protein